MGVLLELAEVLAGAAVALSAGSGFYDYFLKSRHQKEAANGINEGKASIVVTMPGEKSVQFEVPAKDAKRLMSR